MAITATSTMSATHFPRHLLKVLSLALVQDEAHRYEVVSVAIAPLCLFHGRPIDSNYLLAVGEVEDLCLVNVVFVVHRVLLSQFDDSPVILFHSNVPDDIVIPDKHLDDSLALLEMHVVALAFLRSHKVLIESLVMVSQYRVLARVERIKFRVVIGVLRVVVPQRDSHAMDVLSRRANLEISCAHIQHLFLQFLDKIIHV